MQQQQRDRADGVLPQLFVSELPLRSSLADSRQREHSAIAC